MSRLTVKHCPILPFIIFMGINQKWRYCIIGNVRKSPTRIIALNEKNRFYLYKIIRFHLFCHITCRRILSMGAHSSELYCNLGICCLYGGHLDLILPCFQRAIFLAIEPNQKSGIWYNLSFVALVRIFDIGLGLTYIYIYVAYVGYNLYYSICPK